MSDQSHCTKCGLQLADEAPVCSECGAIQESFYYKSRIAAAVLALSFGIIGAHRFYLGQKRAWLYLLFFWTYIPFLIGIVEAIIFFCTDQKKWNTKHNQGIFAGNEKGTIVIIFALLFPLFAVLGILAAVAIPAYQDYTIRVKLAEGLVLASEIKPLIEDYVVNEQQWPANNIVLGLDENINNQFVSLIEVQDGVIYADLTPETGTSGTIILVPSYDGVEFVWTCNESAVEPRYLPSGCQNN